MEQHADQRHSTATITRQDLDGDITRFVLDCPHGTTTATLVGQAVDRLITVALVARHRSTCDCGDRLVDLDLGAS